MFLQRSTLLDWNLQYFRAWRWEYPRCPERSIESEDVQLQQSHYAVWEIVSFRSHGQTVRRFVQAAPSRRLGGRKDVHIAQVHGGRI